MGDDRLRALFDVLDAEGTEERLKAALDAETTGPGRAEVLTQLARVVFWLDRRDEAESLLQEADSLAGETGVARARVLLERGRIVRHTSGDTAALPLLQQAYEVALAAGQHFIAADAAHSCALAGEMVAWTNRGLELADSYEAARYWRGTLLLNLGDWQWEQGEVAQSLATFEAALAAREQEPRNPSLTEEARYGVARALRALGRPLEAVPLLEQAVRWVEETELDGPEAREYRKELAAAYDDVGRPDEAAALRATLAR
jgi:tetratricopeptide (TPR) repeat protein